jgi:peptide/nickel transport system permease protein
MLTLRNAEFVEASRMVGASTSRIIRKHLVPFVRPARVDGDRDRSQRPARGRIVVGVGVQVSTPTWGSMLSTTWGTIFSPRTTTPSCTPGRR